MNSTYFEKHESRLKLEAVIKSALCGIALGFGVNFVTALVTWFLPIEGLWISVIAFAAVALISAPVFYFVRFRPNETTNARRIDRMGLDERLITMVEYGNDDSYIAKLQREDAKRALASVDKKQIRFKISKPIIVSVIACTLLGLSMTTVNTLSDFGFMPGGNEIIDSIIEDATTKYVTILYVIEDGGVIDGDEEQIIVLGTNGATVTAVADDGYMFVKWSDGSKNPTRTELEVSDDLIITAEFAMVSEGGDGDGDSGDSGDQPSDQPPSDDNRPGESQGSGTPQKPNQPGGDEGGGASKPNNQIIDGSIYYRDPSINEQYQDAANDRLSSESSGYSEEDIELIKKYLGIV